MKNFSLFILLCCSTYILTAQNLEIYQILNNDNYKLLKNDGFKYKQVQSLFSFDKLPSDLSSFFMESANEEACLLLYLMDKGKQLKLSENGFEKAVFISADNSYNKEISSRSIKDLETDEGYLTVIPLSLIGHDFRDETQLAIEIHFKDGKIEKRWFSYTSFPYDELIENWETRYNPNKAVTKDAWSHLLFTDTWNPMYLTSIPTYNIIEAADTANIPYRPEEASEGFLIAGNFSMPIVVVRGRDDQGRFWRTAGVYVNSEFSWRIAKNASSSPLVPMNTKGGLGVYKSIITSKGYQYGKKDLPDTLKVSKGRPFKTLVFDGQFMHYSNGQDSSAHYYNRDSTAYRTDYKSGNFSTNYLRLGMVRNILYPNLSQWSSGAHIRFDFALPGFAEYEEDQVGAYGKQRLEFFTFWKSPIMRSMWPFRFDKHHSQSFGNITTPGMVQHSLRLDVDVLLGNLSRYNQHLDGLERRISMRFRYENNRLSHRSIGYFFQYYLGRDDLNIRYHLWTSYTMVGLTFRFPQDRGNKAYRDRKLKEIYKYYESYPCDNWLLPCFKSN